MQDLLTLMIKNTETQEKKFTFLMICVIIKLGMHARAAGLILQLAKEFRSEISIENKGKTGDLKRLLSVIDLDIQCQDTVTVTVEGSDEDIAAEEMLAFFEENL